MYNKMLYYASPEPRIVKQMREMYCTIHLVKYERYSTLSQRNILLQICTQIFIAGIDISTHNPARHEYCIGIEYKSFDVSFRGV